MKYETMCPNFNHTTGKYSGIQQTASPLFTEVLLMTTDEEVTKNLYKNKNTGEYLTEYIFHPNDLKYIKKYRFMYDDNKENKSKFTLDPEIETLSKFTHMYIGETMSISTGQMDLSGYKLVETKKEIPFFNLDSRTFLVIKECEDIDESYKHAIEKSGKKTFSSIMDGVYYLSDDNKDIEELLKGL